MHWHACTGTHALTRKPSKKVLGHKNHQSALKAKWFQSIVQWEERKIKASNFSLLFLMFWGLWIACTGTRESWVVFNLFYGLKSKK
jgi:hypothetical protein